MSSQLIILLRLAMPFHGEWLHTIWALLSVRPGAWRGWVMVEAADAVGRDHEDDGVGGPPKKVKRNQRRATAYRRRQRADDTANEESG
ncbi:hypothetical protein VP1G_11181 [Cytospora mali]|uniref:Secreted protein n=1 Tax=Cytospora mali TaxID=578113 RepID=A0A194V7I7_CYTMA|nr:hypothetical protein VP1G_11181 [Valsa mali var. pyri (nom. inval.)]